MDRPAIPRTRSDGWTAERQLRFLDVLAQLRNVSRAAAAVGLSRESAYRLRKRPGAALFVLAWDRALEGHSLVGHASLGRKNYRGNPPKVTKCTKWKDPRFHSLMRRLRDLPLGSSQLASGGSSTSGKPAIGEAEDLSLAEKR